MLLVVVGCLGTAVRLLLGSDMEICLRSCKVMLLPQLWLTPTPLEEAVASKL